MNLSKPIIFTAGLIIGAGSGILATWQYFKTKYEGYATEEINNMLNAYREMEGYGSRNTISEDYDEVNPISDEERRERLLANERMTTNYASMYKNKNAEDSNVQADFRMAEDLADIPTDDATPEEEANKEHRSNMTKPPTIISLEEYENLPAYVEHDTLYYYHYDEILVDDNEEEVSDPFMLIGDALDKYNFRDSDEQIIFVMNYATDTAYEIQRVMGAYTDGNA